MKDKPDIRPTLPSTLMLDVEESEPENPGTGRVTDTMSLGALSDRSTEPRSPRSVSPGLKAKLSV